MAFIPPLSLLSYPALHLQVVQVYITTLNFHSLVGSIFSCFNMSISCLFLVLKLKISAFDVTLLNLINEGMGLEKYIIKERTEIQVELSQVRCQKLGVDSGSS